MKFFRGDLPLCYDSTMEREAFSAALKNVKLKGFVWPDPDDASDLRLIKNVIEHGCHIIGVEKEAGHPEFSYSIGLYLNYQQPEVMIVEMELVVAARVINRIAARFKAGERFTCGVPYDGLHESVPLVFRELDVNKHTEELGFAIWFYRSRSVGFEFPVYQAMWPDRDGRFPSDPNCDSRVAKAQTLRDK